MTDVPSAAQLVAVRLAVRLEAVALRAGTTRWMQQYDLARELNPEARSSASARLVIRFCVGRGWLKETPLGDWRPTDAGRAAAGGG